MITYRELSRPLRLALAAPWCLLLGLAGTAATPAFRQLLLDPATNQPATAVSLSGPNWTGTLDPARLPGDPLEGRSTAPAKVNASGSVTAGRYFATASASFFADDTGVFLNGAIIADTNGCLYAINYLVTPNLYADTVHLAGGCQLVFDGSHLCWIDPSGGQHPLP